MNRLGGIIIKLNREFYRVDCISLAKSLLGKILVRRLEDKLIKCKIVEVESYIGPEDKACHAYNNKKTNRTEIMFKEGGYAYIYLIYGMYNCLNIVSGIGDKPEAVLIRAVEPLNEIETLKKYRNIKSNKIENLTNGPGKLCRALNIDRSLNKLDLVESDELYVEDSKEKFEIIESTRINIDYAEEYKDKLWRFYIKDNKYISKK